VALSKDAETLLRSLGVQKLDASEEISFDSAKGTNLPNWLLRAEQKPGLFDYQKDLVASIGDVVVKSGRGLVSLPTGGGKTRTAVYALLEALARNQRLRAVWLAPTIELLDQAHETIVRLWKEFGPAPDLLISRELSKPQPGEILLTTPQTLINVKDASDFGEWDILVFDEAHQLAAPMFLESVERFLKSSPQMALIGLSATPGRTKTGEIDQLVGIFGSKLLVSKTLGKRPVEFLQKRGILAKLRFSPITPYGLDISSSERTLAAIAKIEELATAGKQVLVFARSVAESEAIDYILRTKGISSAHVDGSLHEDKRRQRISAFGSGSIRVMTNQKVLTTGYDCPAVSNLVIIPKINSAILFEQIVGRAARGLRTGGTATSDVWQFDDHLELHGLPQSYYRYEGFEWQAQS
jgi:DNA repair protein RadD